MLCAAHCPAQLPFYTDNPDVTEEQVIHFEFYNEFDGLQSSQYPNLNQNTANFKLNYGLPHHVEVDVDAPYLLIDRAAGNARSTGNGDVNFGIKWQFLESLPDSHRPALASSFYLEVPSGDSRQQLGSGIADYWLNLIAQEPFGTATRVTGNFGYLFAGNTSTGVLGVTTTKGHVYTGGLSLLHDFTKKITLGVEAYGGWSSATGLGKNELQGLMGGSYSVTPRASVTFAVMGGKFEASPKIGGQIGFAIDLPHIGQAQK